MSLYVVQVQWKFHKCHLLHISYDKNAHYHRDVHHFSIHGSDPCNCSSWDTPPWCIFWDNIFMNSIRFTFLMTRMRITIEMFITCLFMEVIFVTAASRTPLHDAFFGTISFMESWQACFSWSPSSICTTQIFLQLGLSFNYDKFNKRCYAPFCMGNHLHHNLIRGVYVMEIEWFGPKC